MNVPEEITIGNYRLYRISSHYDYQNEQRREKNTFGLVARRSRKSISTDSINSNISKIQILALAIGIAVIFIPK